MAATYIDLADMVKINDANLAPFEASNLLNDAPVVRAMASVYASKGTDHMVITETTGPTVGFRSPNDGRDNSNSEDTVTTIACKILDASFAVDKDLAESYVGGWEALVAREAQRHLRQAFFAAEQQVFLGTGAASGGFDGLADDANYDGLSDDQVVNAGGSSGLTSVWLLRTLPDAVALILGKEGNIDIGDTVVIEKTGSSGTYPALYTPISAWMALQIPSKYDVARICNIDDGSNTLTDDLLAEAIAKFPSARQPNMICMNRRSLRQLQQSRTATNATGEPAPFPSEAFGIPIIATDAIGNAETALT